MPFIKSDAHHILSERNLSLRCKRIADYWLSIWDGDECPARDAVTPAPIKDLLPGLIFFQVVPDRSVTVRMAGTDFLNLLKFELTGSDWLAVTPLQDRDERLTVFSRVARGNIAFSRWTFSHYWQGETSCEKLLLPLRARPGTEGIPILGFVDWPAAGIQPDDQPSLAAIPPPQILDLAFFTKGGRIC
ncbi:MAG TPA: PAS domain-containing protein [Rhizomicrobium sp.]|nr:PAS domain-containing protein [Rhizomicrobium sp.]